MRFHIALSSLLCALPIQALALQDTLMEAWRAAQGADAEYATAHADRDIALEELPQARAQLLPQVSANYSRGRADSDITSQSALGPISRSEKYATKSWAVQFRQPLFRARAIAGYQQAVVLTASAEARHQAAENALMVRFIDAWADRILQAAQRESALVDISAGQAFIELSERQLKAGEVSKQELLEARLRLAQGRLSLAESDRLERVSGLNWRVLTGNYALPPVKLPETAIASLIVDAGSALDFTELTRNHPLVKAAENDVAAARLEVTKAKSDALPTVDLTAARTYTDSESENVIGSKYNTTRYGIQASMPLFTSGSLRSNIREAYARLARAEAQAVLERQRIQRAAESSWLDLQSALARWTTATAQMAVAQSALRQAELGVGAGLSTRADVARAKTELALALRSRAETTAESLKLWARFQEATGSPNDASLLRLAQITKWSI